MLRPTQFFRVEMPVYPRGLRNAGRLKLDKRQDPLFAFERDNRRERAEGRFELRHLAGKRPTRRIACKDLADFVQRYVGREQRRLAV